MALTNQQATHALKRFADTAADHSDRISEHSASQNIDNTDKENDSGCPIFELFYDSRENGAVRKIPNFTPDVFQKLLKEM